jgi:hypothetical protein
VQAGVVCKVATRPDGQFETSLQIEKRDCTVLELASHNALCGQTETVAVKSDRTFQIVDADCEQ